MSVQLPSSDPAYTIQLDTLSEGYDGETCWVQARAGAIPGTTERPPIVVLTMQKLMLAGSDIFFALNEMRSDDLGASWSGPTEHSDTLGRVKEANGIEAVMCDATPRWHRASGTLLSIGHVARYKGEHLMPPPRPRETAWTAYDPALRTWKTWKSLEVPDRESFFSFGSGSAQWVEEPNGDILLPAYVQSRTEASPGGSRCYASTVMRCRYEGGTLRYVAHGNKVTHSQPRGVYEPSLTAFGRRYYLTLRNDDRGYVSSSDDGQTFSEPRPWCFDDGEELGNYNTQQHWVTHSDTLYLVYTRRGLNNDHVFRHRAPLVMAQVDPERLQVIRATEQVVVPELGARLGNFAVVEVHPGETWISVSEWMQSGGPNPHDHTVARSYGSNNRVYVSRIRWAQPNRLAPAWPGH